MTDKINASICIHIRIRRILKVKIHIDECKFWPASSHHYFNGSKTMSVCLQNYTENQVSIVTDYVTYCYF